MMICTDSHVSCSNFHERTTIDHTNPVSCRPLIKLIARDNLAVFFEKLPSSGIWSLISKVIAVFLNSLNFHKGTSRGLKWLFAGISLFTPCVNLYSENAEFPCLKFAQLSLVVNMPIVLKKKGTASNLPFKLVRSQLGNLLATLFSCNYLCKFLDEVDERRWYCWSLQSDNCES